MFSDLNTNPDPLQGLVESEILGWNFAFLSSLGKTCSFLSFLVRQSLIGKNLYSLRLYAFWWLAISACMLWTDTRSLALCIISPVQKYSLWPLKTLNGHLLLWQRALFHWGPDSGWLSMVLEIQVVLLKSMWFLTCAKILCWYGI